MNEFEAISKVAATFIIVQPDGLITYLNDAGLSLLGPAAGRNVRDILGADALRAMFNTGNPRSWKGDVSARNSEGAVFDASIISTPIVEDGEFKFLVIMLQDITNEKAEREALIQSEKMITLGELVAGTSHELNNPLAIVTGYSDLLLEDLGLSPDQRAKIEAIRTSALRAANVVHSLLAFARKRKPERIHTDVNTVVEAAIQLKEYDLRTSGIELKTQLKPELPLVFADPNQIQQVLLNVLNNAHDAVLASHTPNKEIQVATDSFDGEVMIRIVDTGPGISRTDLKKVFDPFFTTKPLGKGTGLGLSISYGIIREHRGEIQIKSLPGRGTEVIIGLPVYESAPLVVTNNVEPSRSSALLKILVVDDEREIGHILQTGLSRMGFVVDSVCSAPEALDRAAMGKYDFVLTDVKMPGGSGFDMFKELCSIDPSYRDRTIFLTGDTSNPATLRVLEDEGLTYFAKPFDFQVIEKFLRERGERGRPQEHAGSSKSESVRQRGTH